LRQAAVIVMLVVFGLVSFTGLAFYRDRIADNLVWSQDVKVERETRLISRVFEMSKATGLIALRRDEKTGRLMITPPPCENSMVTPLGNAARPENTAALALLCTSPQGAEVRTEIEAWNTSYDFLAVRDNRSQDDSCQNSNRPGDTARLKVEVYVPYGCKPNEWRFERVVEGASASATLMSGAEPPFSEFNFLVDPQEPMVYAGDWARVAPDPYSDIGTAPARYRFTSDALRLRQTGVVSIQVVGRLRSVAIDGDVFTINTNNREANWRWTRKANGVYVRAWLLCNPNDVNEDSPNGETDDGGEEEPDCYSEPTPQDEVRFAYQIDISQFPPDMRAARPRAPRNIEVVVEAESNTFLPKSLRYDDAATLANRATGLRLTRHLRADCTAGWLVQSNPTGNCTLSWVRVDGVETPARAIRRIVLGQGDKIVDLVNPETGLILTTAYDRGLAPIIGFGPQDWGSLISTLSTSGSTAGQTGKKGPKGQKTAASDAPPFPLTIDQRIQEAAYDTLKTFQTCQSRTTVRRAKKTGKVQRVPLCNRLRDGQSATLVVLDADKKPGDILAMASLPTPPKKMHMWDLAALDEGNDFLPAGLGWRAAARDNVPGSTFKAVTSVGAITYATSPNTQAAFADNMKKVLQGSLDLRTAVRFLGLAYAPPTARGPRGRRPPCTPTQSRPEDVNTIPVPNATRPFWCARNYGGGARYYLPRAPSATRCPAAARGSGQFGMCEAIMISSNLFFGAVAQTIVKADNQPEPFNLRMARRLTYGPNVQGFVPGMAQPKDIRRRFDLTRGRSPSAKLSADPINMAAVSPQQRREHPDAVVRAGYGDDVQATPLAITTVYASVGSRKVIRPTIVPLERDAQGCPVVKADDDECTDLIPTGASDAGHLTDVLRAGFHAAATAAGGTSTSQFRSAEMQPLLRTGDTPRLFVKTGTATVIASKRFSVWAAGWIEGAPGNIPNRISFACFMTHRSNADTGGATCAPVIREFLLRLNRTAPTQ
jgi:cell division protein FtsI/penicillin-binding protein 2